MKYRYLPAGIMLLAGAITSISCIVKRCETLYGLKLLLGVLLLFWLIGSLTRVALIKIVTMNVREEDNKNEEEKNGEDDDVQGDLNA